MSDNDHSSLEGAASPASTTRKDSPLVVSSEDLLRGRRELLIEHEGQMYRLRVTSRGKLYLTK